MKWIKTQNYGEMSRLVAQLFIKQLKDNRNTVLGFATGSTPIGLYEELVKNYNENIISFSGALSFNLDEYIGLARSNEFSYYYYMYKHLFSHIDMKESNIHIPSGDLSFIERSSAAYKQLIEVAGGIDILLLGIGINGHIGFNEPGTCFNSNTHVVELETSTRKANKIHFDNQENVPTHAITMGIASILKAKKIVLLVSGQSKQAAIDFLRTGEVTEQFPASALHLHEDVTIIYTDVK